jgi:predicted MPP superfamily phosphohydrolase
MMAKLGDIHAIPFPFLLAIPLAILFMLSVYIAHIGTSALQSLPLWVIIWRRFWFGFFGLTIASMLGAKFLPFGLARFLLTLTNPFTLFATNMLLSGALLDLIRLTNYFLQFSSDNLALFSKYWFLITLALIPVMYFVGTLNLRDVQITNLEIESSLPKQNRELRIVLVSDTHLGYLITKSKFQEWVGLINAQHPDIIIFAGDIADHYLEPIVHQKLCEEFNRLVARYGVFAVAGNHESMARPRNGLEQYLKSTTQVKYLRDTSELVNDSIYIVGRDDRMNRSRRPLAHLVRDFDRAKPIIVVDHQPGSLKESEDNGNTLTICGHTHAGQFFPGTVAVRLAFGLSYGYAKRGNSQFYVSSGLGVWGPQCRLGSRSELVRIALRY